jgi:hypothetical protein
MREGKIISKMEQVQQFGGQIQDLLGGFKEGPISDPIISRV